MNRPYIFCHMMTSLDGKIMGSFMETQEGSIAADVFYNISFGTNPYYNHQGWLSGRVTTDDNFTFYENRSWKKMYYRWRMVILWLSQMPGCIMFR